MRSIDRLMILFTFLLPIVMAQLPFFLQRFRPVKHALFSAGSSSYPSFASSFFPLSSSSSLLSPAFSPTNSFLSSSSLISPFSNSALGSLSLSSPFTASASSLSPHFGTLSLSSSNLGSSLLGSSSLASPNFASSQLSGSPSFTSSHLGGSSNLGSSHFSGSPGFGSSQLSGLSHFSRSPGFGSSQLSGSSHFSRSPGFGSSQLSGSSLLLSHLSSPHKYAASNLAQSLVDPLGTASGYEGVGGFDQAELLDDYPGFSNSGFAKELNFAGSQTVKVETPSPYNGNEYIYLQKSNEKVK